MTRPRMPRPVRKRGGEATRQGQRGRGLAPPSPRGALRLLDKLANPTESGSDDSAELVRRLRAAEALALEQRRLREDAEACNAKLREALELREKATTLLVHDVRGPLACAWMNAQLLSSPRKSGPRILRDRIVQSLHRVNGLLEDVLDASRLEAGLSLRIERIECDLSIIAEQAVEELRELHGDRFQLSFQPCLGLWSPEDLRRALWNLGSNAVKYGTSGSRIAVSVRRAGEWALLSVRNEGAPIAAKDLPFLFDRFRPGSTPSHPRKGWGLGLTSVKGCAEAHGGHLAVHSSAAAGTTFTLNLPRTVAA